MKFPILRSRRKNKISQLNLKDRWNFSSKKTVENLGKINFYVKLDVVTTLSLKFNSLN